MNGSCPPEPLGFRLRADAMDLARKRHRRGTSPLSPFLFRAYRFRRLQGFVLRLCARLEGDAFHSATLRRILRVYHEVEVGPYSYGSILRPRVLPPGSRVGAYCSVGAELIVRRRNHPHERLFMHPFFTMLRLGFWSMRQSQIRRRIR